MIEDTHPIFISKSVAASREADARNDELLSQGGLMRGRSTGRGRKWLRRILWTFAALILIAIAGIVYLAVSKPLLKEREVVAPSAGGTRIAEGEMLGNYYPAAGTPLGAILVLGGSDGGVPRTADIIAQALSQEGFNALVLSYWGAPGQSLEMKALPLEAFDRAIEWLKQQPGSGGRVGVMGYSKGAEAALLVAVRRGDLVAVVAGAPTHMSWQAIDPVGTLIGGTSTFTAEGETIPYMPYGNVNFFAGPGPLEIHTQSLLDEDEHPEARIAAERIQAPLLLLCGGEDLVWPACRMARALVERARGSGRPAPLLLAYPAAGHGVLGPPPAPGRREDPLITTQTRTPEADVSARRDAWPRVLAFLRAAFQGG